MGIRTVMITGDNPMTAAAIAEEAGVDDFLAEATPEDKLALIRREQEGGRLVAMTGDGTNDAPALAQADVGVAMNTGTSAAKEAGNMVDLDSNPTKLIDIVEIGKQLLITRGALTTFSVANDIAKYFAIIPAMFVVAYPGLETLNVMRLSSPASAILSAVVFNALIIVGLIPLALRGVRYRPSSASALLQPQPLDLRPRRHRRPVRRDQAARPAHLSDPWIGVISMSATIRQAWVAVRFLLVMTVVLGVALPRGRVRRRTHRPRTGGRLVRHDPGRNGGRLGPHRAAVRRRAVLPLAPVSSRNRRLRRALEQRLEPRPQQRGSRLRRAGATRGRRRGGGCPPRPGARRTRSPPAAAVWTRTSARRTPTCRSRGSRVSGASPSRRCSGSSPSTPTRRSSDSWASQGSTCSRLNLALDQLG